MTLQLDSFYPWLDLVGLAVLAATGALQAARKQLDLIGACFFALVTATGGGTLRDLLGDSAALILMRHELYVTAALLAAASFVVLTRIELAAPWPAVLSFALGLILRGGHSMEAHPSSTSRSLKRFRLSRHLNIRRAVSTPCSAGGKLEKISRLQFKLEPTG